MKTVELSIDSSYLDWGFKEGIRELVQNSIDADAKGHVMSLDYDEEKQMVLVMNKGAKLSRKTLLLGFTTKRGDMDQIGQYGEGMKLGCLGLLKAGCEVTIYNQEETWVPKLVHSKEFDQEVLAFELHEQGILGKLRKNEVDGVRIEISGIAPDQWKESSKQFLIFEDSRKMQTYDTPYGKVLHGTDMFGRIYVNGILVEQIMDEHFQFGYNFKPGLIKVDRDRRMVERYTIKSMTTKCWIYLAMNNDALFPELENLLKKNSPDVQDMHWGFNVDAGLKKRLAESFVQHFGKHAIPVLSQDQVDVANHIGKLGLVYGEAYTKLIQSEIGTLDAARSQFAEIVSQEFDTMDLDEDETANLFHAWSIVSAVMGTSQLPDVRVVKFAEETTLGLHEKIDDKQSVLLARHVLADFGETLRVLIHEVAHQRGDHGSKHFQDTVEETWRDCFVLMRKKMLKFEQPERVRSAARRSEPQSIPSAHQSTSESVVGKAPF